MRYILWVVALLEACEVTNNGRHLGHHLGFYQWLEIRLKPQEIVIFFPLTCQITHKLAICIISSTMFTFINERSWENMHFHSKMSWPPASYDVISRNHSNWLSLNLSQNACERTAPENVRCWCFIVWKNSEKPPPPPMNVRGLKDGMQSGYINCSILL